MDSMTVRHSLSLRVKTRQPRRSVPPGAAMRVQSRASRIVGVDDARAVSHAWGMTRQLAPIAGMIPIVLLIAADVTESLVAAGPGREVGSAVAASVRSWGVWLLLAPAIGAWDSALERRARGVRFAAHGVALVAATIVHLLLHARPRLRDDADVSGVVALEIGMATVLYVLVVAARGLVQRAATAREREFATARQ